MSEQPAGRRWLQACPEPLAAHYDSGLLDLDGTVYSGDLAVPGAVGAVAAARADGLRIGYVTNNAARPPEVVVDHLVRLGLSVEAADVITAAQACAALLAERFPRGAPVLVVGGTGLTAAVVAEGLLPVSSADDNPVAVAQGWSPDLAWPVLAEGAYALRRGLPWFVTNTDLTVPTARGIAPGNGSFVRLLGEVVGREPDVVAGKPHAPLLLQAAARCGSLRPLVVGDRLDTDIEGGVASGFATLLVLTGVTGVDELLRANPAQRPTYVAGDLTGLTEAHPGVESGPAGDWTCGVWSARVGADRQLVVEPGSAPGRPGRHDALRAACAAAWTEADSGGPVLWSAALVNRLSSD